MISPATPCLPADLTHSWRFHACCYPHRPSGVHGPFTRTNGRRGGREKEGRRERGRRRERERERERKRERERGRRERERACPASLNGVSAGLASPAWQVVAATSVGQAAFTPLAGARAYGLVGVAQYLAVQQASSGGGRRRSAARSRARRPSRYLFKRRRSRTWSRPRRTPAPAIRTPRSRAGKRSVVR